MHKIGWFLFEYTATIFTFHYYFKELKFKFLNILINFTMNNISAFLLCLVCAFFSFLILGFNYFALYQLLPIVIFYIFQLKVFNKIKRSETIPFIFYILSLLLLLLFPLAMQTMWYFDINNLASKSSTSGLLFVWLPIYAVIPGIITCLITWIIKRKSEKEN